MKIWGGWAEVRERESECVCTHALNNQTWVSFSMQRNLFTSAHSLKQANAATLSLKERFLWVTECRCQQHSLFVCVCSLLPSSNSHSTDASENPDTWRITQYAFFLCIASTVYEYVCFIYKSLSVYVWSVHVRTQLYRGSVCIVSFPGCS